MTDEKWEIYWNEYASDTYLYGSEITFHQKDDIEYINPLMPPGTVIKQWYSKTNIQAQQIEPSLPMIDGEVGCRITVNIDCPENEQWLIRLVFYNRDEVEAGILNVRDKSVDFKCPLSTYSYRMQLINAGMTRFRFHSVTIQEIEDEEKKA